MTPSVSVVIPTFNYGRYLPRAVDSVLAQTRSAREVLIADDGSTDDTAEVVARYGDAVIFRRFNHSGVYAVRQAMLAGIRGEWFLNLDADNWIEPDFLERMMAAVAAHGRDEHVAFVYPDMELFGDASGRVARPDFDAQRLKTGNYVDMNCVIRTAAARRFGFDPAFNSGQGDYDFFLTLAANGYRGVRVPEARLHYRVHADSISRAVGRTRNHRAIMRRIVRKHAGFFTAEEARAALAAADNRTLVALITGRSPFAGFGQRLADWSRFARAGWRHAQFRGQTAYCFRPARYFAAETAAAEIFYLFRDTPERRSMILRAMRGEGVGLAGSQLFGFTELKARGVAVDCNLRWPRVGGAAQCARDWIERRHLARTGIGRGDVGSLDAHLGFMNRARVVLATTDNTGLPAARLKETGRLRTPLVYVSVGLPERMQTLEGRCPAEARRHRRRLAHVDRFVTYGWAEAEWLRTWLGPGPDVRFVPFGVDTEAWRPEEGVRESLDVVSVGYDTMRDFELLADCARRNPAISVEIATSPECAASLRDVPANLKIRIQMPIERLKSWIASAKIVILPVKENTYSGATTTLLQCMAMGKAVAVSRVGAIRDGYGFEDGVNLRWLEPGSADSVERVVNEFLADTPGRRRLGEGARRHAEEKLGWKRYVDELSQCLNPWLGTGGGES